MHKIYLVSILFFGLLSSSVFGQKLCDTLICKDRQHIKRDYNDLSKITVIVWAGISFADAFMYDTGIEKFSGFQFGAQAGLKNSPLQLGLAFRGLQFADRLDDFAKHGVNGEANLIIKSRAVGRVTGKVSHAYWGCGFQIGRRSCSYDDGYIGAPEIIKIENTWYALMPCIGYQFCWSIFSFDMGLPIGYRSAHYRTYRTLNPSDYTQGSLSVQPCISLGIRF